MTAFYAGVDGGGSKTMAVVVDDRGNEAGRGVAGGSNYQAIGLEAALANLRAALAGALAAAGHPAELPAGALIGLAGIDRPADRAAWQAGLAANPPVAGQVELVGDLHLILYALPDNQGLGVIAGTGSNSIGRDSRNKMVRAGGWGYFFGDEGSGLWLGREALNLASRAADGRGPKTALLPLILEEWNLQQPSDLVGAVYGSGPHGVDNAKMARLSSVVFRAAEQGDESAKLLLHNATNELALMIKACDSQLYFPAPPSLAVTGGLLLHYPQFLEALKRRLDTMLALGEVVRVEDPALVAARAALRGV